MRLALLLALLAGPVWADPAQEAQDAIAALDQAILSLDAADGARDRVAALTETVHAFEAGLAAVRAGLRAAALEEERVSARLATQEAEMADLLGALLVLGQRPAQQLLLHPAGPTGAARSGILLTDVTPALQARVTELRGELAEVATLAALQQDAANRLRAGLTGVQEARAALAAAIADRTPLPKRFTEDAVQTAILIAASETLDGFAAGLTRIARDEAAADLPGAERLKGTLAAPVRGTLLSRFNEADPTGTTRPGLLLATRPRALVTAPAAGTVRFQGPLLDYGNVMILEPARDVLVVLAGLAEVYVATGDVVTTGAPLGLMGARPALNTQSASTARSETLYIELRHNQVKADPAEWFALDRTLERN